MHVNSKHNETCATYNGHGLYENLLHASYLFAKARSHERSRPGLEVNDFDYELSDPLLDAIICLLKHGQFYFVRFKI